MGGRAFSRVLCGAGALLCALAGCATIEPHLMPTPVIFKDERLDLAPRLPAELRSTRLPVFYATTRVAAGEGQPGHYVMYASRLDRALGFSTPALPVSASRTSRT